MHYKFWFNTWYNYVIGDRWFKVSVISFWTSLKMGLLKKKLQINFIGTIMPTTHDFNHSSRVTQKLSNYVNGVSALWVNEAKKIYASRDLKRCNPPECHMSSASVQTALILENLGYVCVCEACKIQAQKLVFRWGSWGAICDVHLCCKRRRAAIKLA
jgi:hypothetical protein